MRTLLKSGLARLVGAPPPAARPARAAGSRRATVIAVATQKGGVGKTTTSVNLAAALARHHGLRVLLVDLDPQGHVATALRATMPAQGPSLARVFRDGGDVLDAVVATGVAGLDATPHDPAMAQVEDLLAPRLGKELVLRDLLRVARTHYDVIVLDCPPNPGALTINGLVAADLVLVPCDPSPLALKGVTALAETLASVGARLNPGLDVLGLVLTRVDGRTTTLNREVVRELEASFGPMVLPVRIGADSALAKAQHAGRDVFAHAPESRAAAQYRALGDLVAARVGTGSETRAEAS